MKMYHEENLPAKGSWIEASDPNRDGDIRRWKIRSSWRVEVDRTTWRAVAEAIDEYGEYGMVEIWKTRDKERWTSQYILGSENLF